MVIDPLVSALKKISIVLVLVYCGLLFDNVWGNQIKPPACNKIDCRVIKCLGRYENATGENFYYLWEKDQDGAPVRVEQAISELKSKNTSQGAREEEKPRVDIREYDCQGNPNCATNLGDDYFECVDTTKGKMLQKVALAKCVTQKKKK